VTSSSSGERWTEEPPGEEARVVVRDRRRIDPDSGQVRSEPTAPVGAGPDVGAAPAGAPAGGDSELVESLRGQVAERTADLQRLKAEFDNYRRRVERDRQLVADQAAARLLTALLPVLDDIARARDHGDLEGPFKAVAEALETSLESAGLERFATEGDPFDPRLHDALMHAYSPEVGEPTCVQVFRSGYRLGERVLRPAQVSVAEPPDEVAAAPAAPADAESPDITVGRPDEDDRTGSGGS
jgi:molecular chaperone GrpE